jgi:hypothetical protein
MDSGGGKDTRKKQGHSRRLCGQVAFDESDKIGTIQED